VTALELQNEITLELQQAGGPLSILQLTAAIYGVGPSYDETFRGRVSRVLHAMEQACRWCNGALR
jgi:hypothetical protein